MSLTQQGAAAATQPCDSKAGAMMFRVRPCPAHSREGVVVTMAEVWISTTLRQGRDSTTLQEPVLDVGCGEHNPAVLIHSVDREINSTDIV